MAWIKAIPVLILLLGARLSAGKVIVNSPEIIKYLEVYLRNVLETFGILDHEKDQNEIIYSYRTVNEEIPGSAGVKRNDVAKVIISVHMDTVMQRLWFCSLEDSEMWLDSFTDKTISKGITFQETYSQYQKIDNAGIKLCNFFEHLRCQPHPTGPAQCECPPRMLWQDSKCVFKKGERCHDLSTEDKAKDKLFPVFDFLKAEFTSYVPPLCVAGTSCNSQSNTCESDDFYDFYQTPLQISALLRTTILYSDPTITKETKEAVLRATMWGLILPQKKTVLRILSLEATFQNRMLKHGQPCDQVVNQPFLRIIQNYKSLEASKTHETRLKFLKEFKTLMGPPAPAQICNHFRLMLCGTENTCVCKDGLFLEVGTGKCRVKSVGCTKYKPGEGEFFHFYDGGFQTNDFLIGRHFDTYPLAFAGCGEASECYYQNSVETWCVPADKLIQIKDVVLKFEKKFSIGIQENCDVGFHEELFNIAAKTTSSSDVFEDIKTIVYSKSDKYCQIQEYATCSKEGKCVCVEPMVPEGKTCTVPYHSECDQVYKSEYQQKLDNIVISLAKIVNTTNFADLVKLSCSSQSKCAEDPILKIKLCNCPTNKYGLQCDADPSPYVLHISVRNLPSDMNTPGGVQVISELHEAVGKLESRMTLNYGDKCEAGAHKKLGSITQFLSTVREICVCELRPDGNYGCRRLCDGRQEYVKAEFENVLQEARDLESESPAFCNWNQGNQCVNNICNCPPDYIPPNNGLCLVDLGADCSLFEHKGQVNTKTATCRPGTECKLGTRLDPRCESTNLVASEVCDSDCVLQVPRYVAEVHRVMLEYLQKNEKDLGTFRTLPEGQDCNPKAEKAIRTILELLNPPLTNLDPNPKPDVGDSNLGNQRFRIRLMETFITSITGRTTATSASSVNNNFCKSDLFCNPESSKCGPLIDKPVPTQPPPSPPEKSSAPASSRLERFYVFLLLIGIAFTL